jgi:hypothetical protein
MTIVWRGEGTGKYKQQSEIINRARKFSSPEHNQVEPSDEQRRTYLKADWSKATHKSDGMLEINGDPYDRFEITRTVR